MRNLGWLGESPLNILKWHDCWQWIPFMVVSDKTWCHFTNFGPNCILSEGLASEWHGNNFLWTAAPYLPVIMCCGTCYSVVGEVRVKDFWEFWLGFLGGTKENKVAIAKRKCMRESIISHHDSWRHCPWLNKLTLAILAKFVAISWLQRVSVRAS